MLRYAGPFVLLASIPVLFYALGPVAPLATPGLLLAALTGAEILAPRGAVRQAERGPLGYRLLLHLYVPAQLGVIFWATGAATHTPTTAIVGLALSVGVTAGVFGMLVAHELIHSKRRSERLLGTAMLSTMCYRHFRIAHVQGHHRRAATESDPATAHLGESFYQFLPRTLAGQYREAFCLERQRCRRRRRAWPANRVVQDALVTASLVAATGWLAGVSGVVFFLAQSAVAIVVLELFNYIAHYGLVRHKLADGRVEPLDDRHSWNSSNVAANLLIFNMGRHAHHHRRPTASYERLQFARDAPELPAGYAASILLALIPPLWHRVMDPRVRCFAAAERRSATSALASDVPNAPSATHYLSCLCGYVPARRMEENSAFWLGD